MDPIINTNIKNFCSPNKYVDSHIHPINPDKFTFLKSNLTVSNILNHRPKPSNNQVQQNDAYNQRDLELKKHMSHEAQQKDKIQRVRQLAKCKSQQIFESNKKNQLQLKKMADQIHIMRLQMSDKAKEIMSRKQDTSYLGRNIFLEGEKFIKKLKDYHPNDKLIKIEATRMYMKQNAKKKNRHKTLQKLPAQQVSEVISCTNLNSSALSFESAASRTNIKTETENDKEKYLMQLIKRQSFDSVLKMSKRQAAWKGFAQNWAVGFIKSDDIISTKKKHKNKKSPKHKQIVYSESGILNYHDRYSRQVALKKYSNAFKQTANSFKIESR